MCQLGTKRNEPKKKTMSHKLSIFLLLLLLSVPLVIGYIILQRKTKQLNQLQENRVPCHFATVQVPTPVEPKTQDILQQQFVVEESSQEESLQAESSQEEPAIVLEAIPMFSSIFQLVHQDSASLS